MYLRKPKFPSRIWKSVIGKKIWRYIKRIRGGLGGQIRPPPVFRNHIKWKTMSIWNFLAIPKIPFYAKNPDFSRRPLTHILDPHNLFGAGGQIRPPNGQFSSYSDVLGLNHSKFYFQTNWAETHFLDHFGPFEDRFLTFRKVPRGLYLTTTLSQWKGGWPPKGGTRLKPF